MSLTDINKSDFSFSPDVKNNQILFGLKGLSNVNDELIQNIISNRPYTSLEHFYETLKPNRRSMISLIKSGAFDQFGAREEIMKQYIWLTCDKKKRITLQNMQGLIKYKLLPEGEQYTLPRRVYEFNRYLKDACAGPGRASEYDSYTLDDRAIDFLSEIDFTDYTNRTLNKKIWDKTYKKYMAVYKDWMAANKDQILNNLNNAIFMEDWNKYAKGNISSWEMESLCFYYHDHELKHVNNRKYGLSDFSRLSENPIVDRVFTKGNSTIPIYKLFSICGTCIAKDKIKSTIFLLTTTGVVPVKFRQEYFSLFDKQVSKRNPDGTKTVIERSWFNRGNMLIVQGIRRGDEFVAKKYANSGLAHTLYHIDEIDSEGNLIIRSERLQGEQEDDEE